MSNELAQHKPAMPALQMDEVELLTVLRTSLYPGARDDSIKMAINYCKAAGLDVMQKPVHLVQMYDAKTKEMRDVVMPGIGLYRTQAARSGAYAGVTEPEFGADVTETFPAESGYNGKTRPEVAVTFPAWCKVIVKRRMPDGQIAEFAATERWKENYATSGKDSKQPNSMWQRRPYAQLAKCAEAQALRKAFPEFGSQPTADEMEGKEFDMGAAERVPVSAAAVERNQADGFDAFEAEHLPAMRAAAMEGMEALTEAFAKLPKGAHKTAFWTRHQKELKQAAASAVAVIDNETGEIVNG